MPSARAAPSLIAYLQELVVEAVRGLPGVTHRKALASDAWFVDDRMFTFVNRQARVVVRLPEPASQEALLRLPGAAPWQYGRKAPLRAWLLLPEELHDDPEGLRAWVQRAHRLVREAVPAPTRRRAAVARGAPAARRPGRRGGRRQGGRG